MNNYFIVESIEILEPATVVNIDKQLNWISYYRDLNRNVYCIIKFLCFLKFIII